MANQFQPDLAAYADPIPEQTVAETILGVPLKQLRRWNYDGRGLKVIRCASRRWIRKQAWIEWLQAREV